MFNIFHYLKNHSASGHKARLHSIYLSGFLLMVSQSLLIYIISSYIAKFVGEEKVGLYFTISYLFLLVINNVLPNYLSRNGVLGTALFLILASIVAKAMMGFSNSTLFILLGFILFNIASVLIWLTLDILLNRNTPIAQTGRVRGLYGTVAAIGLIMSPFLAGFIYDRYNVQFLFTLSIAFLIPMAISLALHFDFHEPQLIRHKYHFLKSLKQMWQRADLRNVFFLSLLINIFYTAMVIYTPLYLTSVVGLSWTSIGMIFTVMLLPYAIVQFPAGWLADKSHRDRAMLIVGLIIISFSTLAISLYSAPNIYLWMIILFMTRFGAALADAMIEAYFFRQAHGMEQEIINFYRNAPTLGYIIGPVIFSMVVLFYGLSAVFPILALMLFCGIILTHKLRPNI